MRYCHSMLYAICGAITVIWILALRRGGPLAAWLERMRAESNWTGVVLSFALAYAGVVQLLAYLNHHFPLSGIISSLALPFTLIPHEGGHFWASLTGGVTFNLMAGALAQTLIPLAFALITFRRAWYMASSICLWFTSLNIGYVAWYILDAKVKTQSFSCIECMLSGEQPLHDMNELLTRAGLLEYYRPLGYAVFFVAVVLLSAAVWLPYLMPVSSLPLDAGDNEHERKDGSG